MKVLGFMVRDRDSGLFRNKNGLYTSIGKVWRKLSYLKNHYNNTAAAKRAQDEIIVMVSLPATNLPVSTSLLMNENDLVELTLKKFTKVQAVP